ncbi:MAG: shikimate kinase [Pygmaiobacter massiliensis]|nr:shikimate kinase [Pygmaiobacter massiliensis]
MQPQRYGLLGEHLGHSFSKIIHEQLADYTYDLIELPPEHLADFLTEKNFAALNVTIPYKQAVMPYLDEIDPRAQSIGAVNTIVNREGKLYGYNTDFDGVVALIEHLGIEVAGRQALILGTGGTSCTVAAALEHLGAAAVHKASRTGKGGALTYEEAALENIELIFNTTPCGMYPKVGEQAISLAPFGDLCGVLDAVYNPLRTALVLNAAQQAIPAEGGLYMLVAQAVRAAEYFLDTTFKPGITEQMYRTVLAQKENLILTGMPGSGKSTVGRQLAEVLHRPFIDIDAEIVKRIGCAISDYFAQYGENAFRKIESSVTKEIGAQIGLVIATGGGTILREDNLAALKQNGRLLFLDRPLEALETGKGRPLSADKQALARRYEERMPRYLATADAVVDGSGSVAATLENCKNAWQRFGFFQSASADAAR